jgi:hypothetical protein
MPPAMRSTQCFANLDNIIGSFYCGSAFEESQRRRAMNEHEGLERLTDESEVPR